jgi:tetratricopeptide (TPR) repeat protein
MSSSTETTFLFEKALLSSHLPPSLQPSSQGHHVAAHAVNGRFHEALTSDWVKDHPVFALAADGRPTVTRPESLDADGELALLSLGVSLLQAFVQANWTGPDLTFTPSSLLPPAATTNDESINSVSLSHLSLSGEPAYHLAKHPAFLLLAVDIFGVFNPTTAAWNHVKTVPVWRLRAGVVQLRVLDEPVPVPSHVIDDFSTLVGSGVFDTASDNGVSLDPASVEAFKDIVPGNTLLLGHYHALLSQIHPPSYRLASLAFVDAAKQAGLEYELTGRLGKRTKFQVEDKTQLVLLARGAPRDGWSARSKREKSQGTDDGRLPPPRAEAETATEPPVVVPQNLDLNDDTLLERTQFTSVSTPSSSSSSALGSLDAADQPVLHPLLQSILLSLSLHTSNNSPAHGLTTLQTSAFVERVLTDPENWSVYSMALLLRSRLEGNRSRTVERGLWQLQSLVDQLKLDSSPTEPDTGIQKEEGAPVSERLEFFYAIALPARWQLEKELAQRFIGLGVIKSALEIFRRLEMWEDAVRCYATIDQREKGIEIVRQLLEGQKVESDQVMKGGKEGERMGREREAKLWCLLGDLEDEPEHYRKAWQVSRQSSGRAMRSLGGALFKSADYKAAQVAFRASVDINPLFVRTWFLLGCAAMLDEEWVVAEEAFGRCTLLDEEDAESWSNLASIHLRRAEKEAFAPETRERADDEEDEGDEERIGVNGNDVVVRNDDPTALALPFARKRSAFNCLRQAIKYSYDGNWRIWTNYMVVAVDVGELSEACRALGRLVEMRADKAGEEAVDLEVLERLVNAVTRSPTSDGPQAEGVVAVNDPNSGKGLEPRVDHLFNAIILPRISTSPRIFLAHARLLLSKGDLRGSVDAHLKAYRAGVAMDTAALETDVSKFKEAALRVGDVVDVLRNLGPREQQQDGELVVKDWKYQARSILRTFVGRTRGSYEGEPEWERLKEELEELKE